MHSAVLEYLRKLSPESKARLTEHFRGEVEEIALLIAKAMEALQTYHASQRDQKVGANPKHVAFGLMTKGANTLVAALELSLAGYRWEPSILLRSALEGCAAAWDVVHNPSRFAAWQTGNFKSTNSISRANEVAPEIGRLWGHLSDMNVHTSPINSSPSLVLTDDDIKFQFCGFVRAGSESVRATEVYLVMFVSYICLQLTELVFYQHARELETVEKIPGADLMRTRVSERHRRFVDAMKAHFVQLVNGSAWTSTEETGDHKGAE